MQSPARCERSGCSDAFNLIHTTTYLEGSIHHVIYFAAQDIHLEPCSQTAMLRAVAGRAKHYHLHSLCCKAWLAAAVDKAIYVTLPQMSPSMTHGSIAKWHKRAGDEVEMYDVVFEVATESLTEKAYKVGEFAGMTTMLVEAQDEGFLHEILVPEGRQVEVGTSVAVMAEFKEDLKALQDQEFEAAKPPDSGRQLTWQSYLKSDKGREGRGCG